MTSEEQAGPRPRDDHEQLDLTDPKAIRALAHPLRWALLEALGHAGTLTATQASEMLGESPANCAFHLRTLAKYGFVEEAGGGKGRERPWRQAYGRMSWRTRPGDEQFTLASEALDQVWLDRVLSPGAPQSQFGSVVAGRPRGRPGRLRQHAVRDAGGGPGASRGF